MCGIHLIIDHTARLTQEPIKRMADALHYRGPDALHTEEIHTAIGKVFIAQNRLRITDIRPAADGVFRSPCDRYLLAYNGEIYNYLQLRAFLNNKYSFRTNTDTEVLLYLLLEEGEKCLQRLNGMFAFIWYDTQQEKILLGRDRFGMKPLYYAQTDHYLVVSSEIKGILASGLIEKKLNQDQIPYYLQYKFARRPATFYEHIYEIMPGNYYTALPGQSLTQAGNIMPEQASSNPSVNVVQQIEETLIESVKRHIPSEVPAGLFLSGGVDSTLILALAREAGIHHLPAFSIANAAEDQAFGTQDYHFARLAARQYGAEYHELSINSHILEGFSEFIGRMDQPVGDGAAWLTFLLSEKAKPYVKVILSGAGADEMFAGYNRHWAYYQYLKHYNTLIKVLPALKKTALAIPSGRKFPFRKPLRLLQKMLLQANASPQQTFINFTAHLNLTNDKSIKNPESVSMNEAAIEAYLQEALQYDQQHYLSSDVLTITDRMTMQHGLEARMPYLDAELVKLVEGLPASFLLKNGKKWILKDILNKRNGQAYVRRAKEGFGMPFGQWLRAAEGRFFIELLKNPDQVLYQTVPYQRAQRLLQAHLTGKMDYSSELWTMVVLAAWIQQEFT
jgi:asparagine synthase (glutamine-hydrolysing)